MAKRRLPLLAPTSDSGASVPTPGHWILAMAALAFTAWLPLSLAALWAAQLAVGRSGDPGVGGRTAALAVVGLLLGSFLLATGLASALVRGTVERS